MEATARVRIHNHLPTAVALHLDEMHDNEHGSYSLNVTGTKTAKRGEYIELQPGPNMLDADWWRAWAKQHEGTALAAHFSEEPINEQPAGRNAR